MRFRAMDMRPVLDDIADDYVDSVEHAFATEGAGTGWPWKQLERETYLKRGSKHPILVEHADLLLHATDRRNAHVSHDGIQFTFPSSIRTIAESHQYGFFNVAAGHDVPARPIVRVTEFDRIKWKNMITSYLVESDR